jgi:hypothetical protein
VAILLGSLSALRPRSYAAWLYKGSEGLAVATLKKQEATTSHRLSLAFKSSLSPKPSRYEPRRSNQFNRGDQALLSNLPPQTQPPCLVNSLYETKLALLNPGPCAVTNLRLKQATDPVSLRGDVRQEHIGKASKAVQIADSRTFRHKRLTAQSPL